MFCFEISTPDRRGGTVNLININIGDLEVSIAGMVESGRKAGNFAECFEHILRHFRQRRVKVGGVTVLAASKLLQTYH